MRRVDLDAQASEPVSPEAKFLELRKLDGCQRRNINVALLWTHARLYPDRLHALANFSQAFQRQFFDSDQPQASDLSKLGDTSQRAYALTLLREPAVDKQVVSRVLEAHFLGLRPQVPQLRDLLRR